jgi:hypothetical protein
MESGSVKKKNNQSVLRGRHYFGVADLQDSEICLTFCTVSIGCCPPAVAVPVVGLGVVEVAAVVDPVIWTSCPA